MHYERWKQFVRFSEFRISWPMEICNCILELTIKFQLLFLTNSLSSPLLKWTGKSTKLQHNKANLRDLIAATGLVILLKLDSNHRFFSPCDLKILMDDPEK